MRPGALTTSLTVIVLRKREVPDSELLIHSLGIVMELNVQVVCPVYQVLKLGISGMLRKYNQEMHKHTYLNMADLVCLTAIVIGIVRQTVLIVNTNCILDRSAADTNLTHQP